MKAGCIADSKCSASAAKVTDPICRIGSLRELFGAEVEEAAAEAIGATQARTAPKVAVVGLADVNFDTLRSTLPHSSTVDVRLCVVLHLPYFTVDLLCFAHHSPRPVLFVFPYLKHGNK